MINRPHALYYNGELIGIITNPDPFGTMADICDALSPDEGMADAVTIPHNMGNLDDWAKFAQGVVALGVAETIELDGDDGDSDYEDEETDADECDDED